MTKDGARRVVAGRRPPLGSPYASHHAKAGAVVVLVNTARTQNGHIRNDTRDASRRILGASIGTILQEKLGR
jgi:hypothetical protein